ncbi:MAG: SsrA-binding protein SmpB [Candidatus Neomarinimicrobiota bacterium]
MNDVKIIATNRKAYHNYHILDKFEAGLQLTGSEVKSLREGKANIKESYVMVRESQVWLMATHISPYSHTGFQGHDPTRARRLLLHRREIQKLRESLDQKGLTAIPLKIYFNKRGKAKIEIGLAKGKKTYDKKIALKERDIKRETDREMRSR